MLTSRLTSVQWSLLQSSLRCMWWISANPNQNHWWATLHTTPLHSPPTPLPTCGLFNLQEPWLGSHPRRWNLAPFSLSLFCPWCWTRLCAQLEWQWLSLYWFSPQGTTNQGMKATLLMTNNFVAYLYAAQSEMVYKELVCPISIRLALSSPVL